MDMHQALWKVHPILRPHVFEQTVHHGLPSCAACPLVSSCRTAFSLSSFHHAQRVESATLPRLRFTTCPDVLVFWSPACLLVYDPIGSATAMDFQSGLFGPQHQATRAPGHGHANCLIGLAIAGLEFLEHAGCAFRAECAAGTQHRTETDQVTGLAAQFALGAADGHVKAVVAFDALVVIVGHRPALPCPASVRADEDCPVMVGR